MQPAANNQPAVWEPDASNRVWRRCDGSSLWLKSGQCNVRSKPLALTNVPLQVLYGANLAAAPQFTLTDLVEGSTYAIAPPSTQPYAGNALFQVATYSVSIYPGTSYAISSAGKIENPADSEALPCRPFGHRQRFAGRFGSVAPGSARFQRLSRSRSRFGRWPSRVSAAASPCRFRSGMDLSTRPSLQPQQQDGTWQASLQLYRSIRPSPSIFRRRLAANPSLTTGSTPAAISLPPPR